jgi:DNA-binding winged helix-turn-helix (wHTH) protein
VLQYLVEHAGQLVTKEALFAAVWPELVVSEGVLTNCIGELRKTLGDAAQVPRFIATVHRRGYRFIAPVTLVGPSEPTGHMAAAAIPVVPAPPPLLVGRAAEVAALRQGLALFPASALEEGQRHALEATRERMLREAAEFLEAVSAEQPLVLVLEDLHWSDHATLDLLTWLARRREPAWLLVLGTFRPVEVIVHGHPLRAVTQELALHGQCVELRLEGLSEAEVIAYLKARFPGSAVAAQLARVLYRCTGGQPLFMVQTVDAWVQQDWVAEVAGQWGVWVAVATVETGVAESVRQMIARQFDGLAPEVERTYTRAQAVRRSQEALAQAQALAHPYSLAFAQHYAAYLHHRRRDAPAVQAQAEALLTLATAQGFPIWVGMGTFWHGWGLSLQGQGEAGLSQMHQGLAAVVATGQMLARPRYLVLLAEEAGHAGQVAEGLRLLTEALTGLEASGQGDMLAEAYRLQGVMLLQQAVPDMAQAEPCFQQALALARRQQAKSWELRAAMSLARLWQHQGKPAEAQALLAPIYGWFTEGFDTVDLREAAALLNPLTGREAVSARPRTDGPGAIARRWRRQP